MNKLNLNENWLIRGEELWVGPELHLEVQNKKEGWMEANLPCDIHMPLLERGLISEPVEADNSYSSEWIEDKSWWFKKSFDINSEMMLADVVDLSLEYLDAEADVFLNEVRLGHQKSTHYPFVFDIKNNIVPGENTLLVRVTSGLEHVSDNQLARLKNNINTEESGGRGDRGDRRRAYVRKPQYVYGWDWGPRVATCGINGNAYIKWHKKLAVRTVHAFTKLIEGNSAQVAFEVEVENLHQISTIESIIKIELEFEGSSVLVIEKEALLRSGNNYIRFDTMIEDALLWWPRDMGRQNLYTVKASAHTWKVSSGTTVAVYPSFKLGIRTIELIQDKINEEERIFALQINGEKVFCKGGNWIPADSIYARVSEEKYDSLLQEAYAANFNMLRVWGGGIFEPDFFYEKCDELGIMIWHDFMFGCALYPDYLDWFMVESEKEIDYQTRRLRNHPAIVLWCGNNENHTAFEEWWKGDKAPTVFGGAKVFNQLAPAIVHKNCPEIPYWNSSPYGGTHANDSSHGDVHRWGDGIMNEDMNVRISPYEFDKCTSKFISEYGYVGPCRKSTIEKYHAGNKIDTNSRIWKLHNNTFEKDTVIAGIEKHYKDADQLDLDSYLLYAGLCQGMMLGYSLESFRFNQHCYGGLFWMFNDCWGEVGWTIIDYYLKRKISYYFVKRAFASVKFILRKKDEKILVVGINETSKDVSIDLEYGYVSFDGKQRNSIDRLMTIPARSRGVLLEIDEIEAFAKEEALLRGTYFVKPKKRTMINSQVVLPEILKLYDFRQLILSKEKPQITNFLRHGNNLKFTVTSNVFIHAVHFNFNDEIHLSDEYFDLLPGESREVEVYDVPEDIFENFIKVNYL